jgi:DNA-binding protein HU-beta
MKGNAMNKAQLTEILSEKTDLSKAKSAELLDVIFDTVKLSLKQGEEVALPGLGKLKVAKRDAKMGRNPRTGEAVKIEAKNVVKFTPAKELKDAVNK